MLEKELDELKFKRQKMLMVAGQSGNFMAVLALFSTIFTFHSHPMLRAMYEATGLPRIFGPLSVLLEGLEFSLAAADYHQSLNRNRDKFINMTVKFAKFALITVATAIMLGVVIANTIAIPVLFLGAIGVNLVANTVTMVRARYHMHQLQKAGKQDSATYRSNEASYKNARLGVGLGLVYTVGVVGLFLVPALLGVAVLASPVGIGIAIGVAAVAVVASAVLLGRTIYKNFQLYKAYKQAQEDHVDKLALEENERIAAAPQPLPRSEPELQMPEVALAKDTHTNDYFYRKGRLLSVEKGSPNSQQYLIAEVDAKLQQLNTILAKDSLERKKNPLSFQLQKSKRLHKVDALEFIKGYIEGRLLEHDMKQIQKLGDVKQFYVNRNKEIARQAFSSWNRDVGDVEDIFDAVNKFAFGDAEPLYAKPPMAPAA